MYEHCLDLQMAFAFGHPTGYSAGGVPYPGTGNQRAAGMHPLAGFSSTMPMTSYPQNNYSQSYNTSAAGYPGYNSGYNYNSGYTNARY